MSNTKVKKPAKKTAGHSNESDLSASTTTSAKLVESASAKSVESVELYEKLKPFHPMKYFRIKHTDTLLSMYPSTGKGYRIAKLDEIKNKLSSVKSQLDKAYLQKSFGGYWREFDPFKDERKVIADLGMTYNISNAWIKCYEILLFFKLLPETLTNKDFMHFDNASFPGSFIASTHHLVRTMYSWGNKYQWRASSLIEANKQTTTQLEDKYGLYKEYPSRYLMNDHNNGDVLNENNQKDFHKQIGDKVDLYTSDLGFDVSSDYNNQEMIQAPANIGQILSGLLTLRKGGCFITKQYTIFEPILVSVMYATSLFFDEFYVCKPYSSREANSETYLVGKGFKGGVAFDHPYIAAMFDRISERVPINIPLFDEKDYPIEYIDILLDASKQIFGSQMDKINHDLERASKCIANNYHGNFSYNPIVISFKKEEEEKLSSWYFYNPIYPMEESKKLIMRDSLGQRMGQRMGH